MLQVLFHVINDIMLLRACESWEGKGVSPEKARQGRDWLPASHDRLFGLGLELREAPARECDADQNVTCDSGARIYIVAWAVQTM